MSDAKGSAVCLADRDRTALRVTVIGLYGVRLATVLVGTQRVTTVEALLRFFSAVSEAKYARAAGRRAGRPAGPADVAADLDREGL